MACTVAVKLVEAQGLWPFLTPSSRRLFSATFTLGARLEFCASQQLDCLGLWAVLGVKHRERPLDATLNH